MCLLIFLNLYFKINNIHLYIVNIKNSKNSLPPIRNQSHMKNYKN